MTFETHLKSINRRPSSLAFWDAWVDGGRREVILIRQQLDTPRTNALNDVSQKAEQQL